MSEITDFFNIDLSSISILFFILMWIVLAVLIFKAIMYFKFIHAITDMKKNIKEINEKINTLSTK